MGLLSKKKTPNPEELYNACKTNNRAEVTRLIDAKCDPQAHADPFTGDVCLHVCANKNRYELMETLLKAGADINLLTRREIMGRQCSALMTAAAQGHENRGGVR